MLRALFLSLFFAVNLVSADAAPGLLRLNLKDAMSKSMVSVSGTATAQSYRQRGLRLTVLNKSGSQLLLTVDPGLIFSPQDSAQQDLVLVGTETINVAPFKEAQLDVQTFCAQARDAAPVSGASFTYTRMGTPILVQVLEYVKRNFLLDALGQSAVWVVTDGYNPATAYDAGRDVPSRKLVAFLEGITGRKADSYFSQYAQTTTPGAPVVAPRPLKIVAQFEQLLEAPKKLTLGVYDAAGKTVQGVFADRTFGKGGHRFRVEFQSANVAAGRYFVRLLEGTAVLQETAVEVR